MKDKLYFVYKEVMAKNVIDAVKKEKQGKVYYVSEAAEQPIENKNNKKVGFTNK